MSKIEDTVCIRHMLDAARKAIEFCTGRERTDPDEDEKPTPPRVRLLEVLGEAAKNVSQQTRQSYPDIQWRQIAGTRDRLIHGYFDVDLGIVWQIVSKDLPDLVKHLEKTLSADKG